MKSDLAKLIENVAETQSFCITMNRFGKEVLNIKIPGSKLYDVNENRVTFFDSATGLEVEIWFTPDVKLKDDDFSGFSGFSGNEYNVKFIDNTNSDKIEMFIDNSEKNKNGEYNFFNKLYILV